MTPSPNSSPKADAFFHCVDCGSTFFLISTSDHDRWLLTCKDCASSYESLPSGSIQLVRHGAEMALVPPRVKA